MNKKKLNFLSISKISAKTADEKKGENILLLNVKRFSSYADYLLIITAGSFPQINAISENIKNKIKDAFNILPIHREGRHSGSWAVMDYGGLIIHIMTAETRNFYRIENLVEKARKIPFLKS